jgi:hypothetical protein
MSLVCGLVDSQGGTIRVDSEVDLGTTVTIELPATAPATSFDASLSRPARGDAAAYVDEALQWLAGDSLELPNAGGRPLVLVVDDNADMRRHLERVLSERWDTVTVGDADSALAAVRERSPDLVVTDVMMPTAWTSCPACAPILGRRRFRSSCSRPAPVWRRPVKGSLAAPTTISSSRSARPIS